MIGVAQHWFSIVSEIYMPLLWDWFTKELLQGFSGLEIQNPYEQLAKLQQVNLIHAYIEYFEYLLSLVPRLSLGYKMRSSVGFIFITLNHVSMPCIWLRMLNRCCVPLQLAFLNLAFAIRTSDLVLDRMFGHISYHLWADLV